MNYRHAFHAGNFADAFKHLLLTRILVYLTRKDAPLRYLDTHAGIGRYDLAGEEAQRTQEWRGGIGAIPLRGLPGPLEELVAPWLAAVGERDAEGRPLSYPGSPALAQRLLRPQDKLILCELHPKDFQSLRANMGRDQRVKCIEIDGYTALKAYVPPPERRGLVVVDPPFESTDEFERMAQAVLDAYRKWPTGVYALWHPVKDERVAEAFYKSLRANGVTKLLRLELALAPTSAEGRLVGTGLAVINPPHVLAQEARILLPWLASRMGGAQARTRIEDIA
jgi:23S rRNA (adenine2030-N6)-methyltransferase